MFFLDIIALVICMKVIKISELKDLTFSISDISVIYQTPSWQTLGGENDRKRILNGYLLIDKGKCKYQWRNNEVTIGSGDLIYLPSGGERFVTVTEKPFSFYRISFVLTDTEDGEQIIFSKTPELTANKVGESYFEICKNLLQSTLSKNNMFYSMSQILNLFQKIEKLHSPVHNKRIQKLIEYVDNYYTDNASVDELANMCFLSKPQMFRLFKAETGKTPVDYRNELRIKKACQLIQDGECSVSEIAEMLGFESIYYFSRVFKKYTGISPSKFK